MPILTYRDALALVRLWQMKPEEAEYYRRPNVRRQPPELTAKERNAISAELVGKINTLVESWNTADRRLRGMFHGWEQRATRAGLERGFYIALAQLPGAETVIEGEIEDRELAGRAVYAAYRAACRYHRGR